MSRATGPKYYVPFKRRRKGLTNYRKRMFMLKSGKVRLVVRKTNKQVLVQFFVYEENGDKVIANAASGELKKLGWKAVGNSSAAYLTGKLAALRAKGKVKDAVLDIGLHAPTKGSVVFAAAQGAVDAGIPIPLGPGIVVKERIEGKHLNENVQKLFIESNEKLGSLVERKEVVK